MKSLLMAVLLACSLSAVRAESDTGKATYYTCESCQREGTSGVYTASGERYDESKLTCALPRRGWGGIYKVTNLDNDLCIYVRHNDFGPGKGPRAKGVVIDLTPAAFQALGGKLKDGIIKRVKYERLDAAEVRVLKKQGKLAGTEK